MPFLIARALNEPFGYDSQDIQLNRLAAETSHSVLQTYDSDVLRLPDVVKGRAEAAKLFGDYPIASNRGTAAASVKETASRNRRFTLPAIFRPSVAIPFTAFAAWIAGIVKFTLKRAETQGPFLLTVLSGWSVNVPFNLATVRLLGLGVFSLLGHWMNDAYGRYRRALEIWQTELRSKLDVVALHFAVTCRPSLWHHADRERIFSFLSALPIAVKLQLSDSRDVSEFEGVLAPSDLEEVGKAADMTRHCLHVLHGYINSMDSGDKRVFRSKSSPVGTTKYALMYNIWAMESAIVECTSLKKFPLSPSFSNHIHIFTAFWLALLPFALLGTSGLFSFLCLLPVGYSLIRLTGIGRELADPFGRDEDDVPMDTLCEEMKESIQNIYKSTKSGPFDYVKNSSFYSRDLFQVAPRTPEIGSDPENKQPTFGRSVQSILDSFVSVNPWSQYAVIVWSCVSVAASYALSFVWDVARRSQCRAWCSPIDVSGDILVNVGFALFMILSFRASSALRGYESGAALLDDVRRNLRHLALEFVQVFTPGKWHEGDKERIIAHLAQVPLALRDEMIGSGDASDEKIRGLLSSEDLKTLEASSNKIDHLLNVVEAYVLTMDCSDPAYIAKQPKEKASGSLLGQLLGRISSVRESVRKALGVKRFPGSVNYERHQKLFTGVWLALLPLSMTSTMGFFTLLWAPLISYGILGLESIARELMDPFGTDSADLPIRKTCDKMISEVLETVSSVNWDCRLLVTPSPVDSEPYLGRVLHEGAILPQHLLPHVERGEESAKRAEPKIHVQFAGPHEFKEKPTPYAHMLHSVPWRALGFIFSASGLGVLLSYFIRKRAVDALWWQSHITIGAAVAGHVSFAGKLLMCRSGLA